MQGRDIVEPEQADAAPFPAHPGTVRSHFVHNNVRSKSVDGKHGVYDKTTIIKPKEDGVEPGALISTTKSKRGEQKQTSFIEKIIAQPVQEKIYLDITRHFANAASSRLALRSADHIRHVCTRFETTKNQALGESLDPIEVESIIHQLTQRDVNNCARYKDQHVSFLSKLVKGYADLEACIVIDTNGDTYSFMDFISLFHRPPTRIIHPSQPELALPLHGVMAIAASAKLIGDIDWLGGSGKNTGAVVCIKNGQAYALAVNVDAGFAVGNTAVIPKHIQYAAMSQHQIQLDQLTQQQYNEFMHSLYLIVNRYHDDEKDNYELLFDYLVWRDGSFEQTGFSRQEGDAIIAKIITNIETLKDLFSAELSQFYIEHEAQLEFDLVVERERDQKCLDCKPHTHSPIHQYFGRFFSMALPVATAAVIGKTILDSFRPTSA